MSQELASTNRGGVAVADDGKAVIRRFWNTESCGERTAVGDTPAERFAELERLRYEWQPYLKPFAKFETGRHKDVLEIGVGMGTDHVQWARSRPKSLTGRDLAERAVEHTRRHLDLFGLTSDVGVGDAVALDLPDNSFDVVYSWGVLHHSPDTPKAAKEVHRVLRPGGEARIMIYHHPSLVGIMLWIRYALLAGKPWRSLRYVYENFLESQGTKAYTVAGARKLFTDFSTFSASVALSPGDLLEGVVGERRHEGKMLRLAKAVWPRWLIRALLPRLGIVLMIKATK